VADRQVFAHSFLGKSHDPTHHLGTVSMVEIAAPAPKVKTPKKKTSKPKTPANHPKYSQMVKAAIAAF